MTLISALLGFAGCSAVIVFAGIRLARYADALADVTGWGKAWVGMVLLSAVTTLPEMISGISAVATVGEPDLAAGNALGSCVFNLLVLSIIDFQVRQPITSVVKTSHLYGGLYSMVAVALCGAAVLTDAALPALGWISPFTPVLIGLYFFSMRGIYRYEKMHRSQEEGSSAAPGGRKEGLSGILISFGVMAVIVVVTAYFLPVFGDALAGFSGLGETFFGTLFLAAATSLPEMVVAITSVRMKAYDLAVGNILGANIINMFILALDDIFYVESPLFRALSQDHLLSLFVILLMSAIAGIGLMARSGKTYWKLGVDTLLILILYLLLLAFLFLKAQAG